MGFRSPSPSSPGTTVLSITDTNTSGNQVYSVRLPLDLDSIIVKVWGNTSGTFSGTTPTCDIYFETTDYSTDSAGVQQWYSIINAGQFTGTNAGDAGYPTLSNARFFVIPASAAGSSRGISSASVVVASLSAVGAGAQVGVPLLSRDLRVVLKYGGTIGNNSGVNVRVYAVSQKRAF